MLWADPTRGVRIRELQVLRGPNLYAYFPVLKAVVDIGPYEDRPSSSFPGFIERLTAWLPGLQSHECSLGRPGGFVERLQRGTYLAHIAEHVAIELQQQIGFRVTYGRARGNGERGVYHVIVAFREEEPARAAFETAFRLTLAAMHGEAFNVAAEIARLRELADLHRLGPSSSAIVAAARRRDIPVMRLQPASGLVQLGYGVHQKRISASETSNTSAIAVDICQEKPLTNRMLRSVGVPVPEGRLADSADDAWAAARDIGCPVVIKPEAGNQGKGVSMNLTTEAEVRAAYEIARQFGGDVLVERQIEGDDHRFLVINGKLVAAARREPAQVVGDGQHTVRELIDQENANPLRGDGHASELTRIRLDAAALLVLDQQVLTPESVPADGQRVKLRHNANLSTGGTATDVTDEVCPSIRRAVEVAAQFLALDVAGIDVLCRDVTRPLGEQGGAIVEVNAAPGLRMHLHPTSGTPRDVGEPIIEMLYPKGTPSRIPIIAITGTNGKTTVTHLVGHMFETARRLIGMTTTEGIYIDHERIVRGDCSGPQSARTILLHPRVEVAVLETARGGILREGLAFDWCTVGVVTNVSADHLGLRGVSSLDDLVRVKQVVIENVHVDGAAVLNADDQLVAEMAAVSDAPVIYFSMNPQNHIIVAHRAAGGRCVLAEENRIVLATGRESAELVDLARVPFTASGAIDFQVQNALAAVAAAWGAGLNPAFIVRALATFSTDGVAVPGRFNQTEIHGVQVIADYGHNRAAIAALGRAMAVLGRRRTTMLLGLPGDRRDEDLIATLEETFSYVDDYVLYDPEPRGRRPGEVPDLLRAHLPAGAMCEYAEDQEDGIRKAWRHVRPGDRMIIIVSDVDRATAQIEQLTDAVAAEEGCEISVPWRIVAA